MPSSNKLKKCGRKRACWLEAPAELLYRASISDLQTYDHNRAYEFIARIKSVKPIVRCKLLCLNDAIKLKKSSTFGTQPPRRLYHFRDIQRFYSFADHPTILILGCNDPERKTRNYDYFKLDENTVKELCDLISRAHNHPLCILTHEENSLVRYHSSQSSLAAESEGNSNANEVTDRTESKTEAMASPATSNGDMVNEVEELMETAEKIEELAQAINYHEPPLIEEVKCEAVHYTPKHLQNNNPIPDHLRSDPLFLNLCKHVNEDDLWAVDMKYINPHPERGCEISSTGSIYLFVAHHKYPDSSQLNGLPDFQSSFDGKMHDNTAEPMFTTTYVA